MNGLIVCKFREKFLEFKTVRHCGLDPQSHNLGDAETSSA